jgi:carboxymethylenebutenolidase
MLTPELQVALFDPKLRDEVQPKMRAAMAPITQPEYSKGALVELKQCVDYLIADEHVNGQVGVLGFCFGGSYSFHLAASDSRIKAAVPFYGHAPTPEEISTISCPALAFYGDQDAGLMESLPGLKEEMEKNHKEFEAVVYPGAGHAFFNDTNARMYNAPAAKDAWEKTLAFLTKNLTT